MTLKSGDIILRVPSLGCGSVSRRNLLVSLAEMLLTYSRAFAVTCADIEMTRGLIYSVQETNLAPDHALSLQLKHNFETLLGLCAKIPSMDRMINPINRLLVDINKSPPPVRLVQTVEHLQYLLFDELERHMYYHVEERLVPYYNSELPFGEEVFSNFPSATDDIRNAGRCLALGQGTAAVFHTMLVLELGLTALGKALGIPYAPSWEAYLRQISTKMTEKHSTKSAAWKRDEAFYRDVAGDLQMVKIAWRNPTMHIVRGRNYEVADAENIYKAAQSLMMRLATKLKESTRRAPAIVGLIDPSAEQLAIADHTHS